MIFDMKVRVTSTVWKRERVMLRDMLIGEVEVAVAVGVRV